MSLLQRIFGAPTQQAPMQMGPNGVPVAPNQMGHSVTTMGQPPMLQNSDGHVPNNTAIDPNNPQATPIKPAEDVSLLDPFKQLWTMDTPKEGAINPNDPVRFNVDQAKVRAQASKIDFTKVITPEIMAKINGGGPEATAALMTAMSSMAQEAVANATLIGTKITEAGLETSQSRMKETIPGLVRNQAISNALREDNPLFANPAVAPMLEAIQSQMAAKFPNATAAEIAEQARKYIVGFAAEANKAYKVDGEGKPVGNKAASLQDYDWSSEPIQ